MNVGIGSGCARLGADALVVQNLVGADECREINTKPGLSSTSTPKPGNSGKRRNHKSRNVAEQDSVAGMDGARDHGVAMTPRPEASSHRTGS